MSFKKIKSYAKINIALNVIGKNSSLHKIETIVAFTSLHDDILIKKIKSKKHTISFHGRFSKNIDKKNTISKLLEVLEKKKLLSEKKFQIKINKKIPNRAGLGGGSMNAASILKYFVENKIIKTNQREIELISKSIGSDVIFGLNFTNSVLSAKNELKRFKGYNKFYTLIVKPNFGCSTKYIYSKVRNYDKPQFNKPTIKMFNFSFLKRTNNSLESIALLKYPKLKIIKLYLESISKTEFVRMTGSGSALVAYYQSKASCHKAKKMFKKKYKNYWCIASKTI
tara:strand:- start:64 stop:909 length:846 start_codon:yes stop_codon:yes gene_type:complete